HVGARVARRRRQGQGKCGLMMALCLFGVLKGEKSVLLPLLMHGFCANSMATISWPRHLPATHLPRFVKPLTALVSVDEGVRQISSLVSWINSRMSRKPRIPNSKRHPLTALIPAS